MPPVKPKNLLNLLIFSFFLVLASCSTELDVNAPKQEVKVMYAVIDPNLPFQTIRVSKAFLSDGSRTANDIAKNSPDSSLYNPDHLLVEFVEYKNNRETRRWTCTDTILTGKADGVFYSPDQMVFRTPDLTLDTAAFAIVRYEFRVKNKLTNKESVASTNVPGRAMNVVQPIADVPGDPGVLNFFSTRETTIRLTNPINSAIAQLGFRWQIQVVRNNGTIADTTIEEWPMNSPGISQVSPSGTNSFEIKGLVGRGVFYNFMGEQAAKISNENVVFRRILTSPMDVYVGNKEYDNYRTVNGNYNAITQSTPIYSNVSDGLGIVCSRNYRSFAFKVSNTSIDSLIRKYPDLKLRR